MSTGELNPNEINLIWGVHRVQGFAPGTSITIVRDANNYNYLIGADNESARINTNNLAALFTFILMQSALSNDYLSAQSNIDRKTGLGSAPLLFKDNWGNTVGAAAAAWIEKDPDQGFDFGADATIQTRSWSLRCPSYEGVIGSSRRA